jgi:uncharacterized protein YbjQ (UPF0145 family)
MEIVVGLVLSLGLLVICFAIGTSIEQAHFRRLEAAEYQLSGIAVSDMKRLPVNWRAAQPVLVAGEAVVATDRFKVFAASLRNFFGGRVRSYETLVERARRQAIIRMLRQAQQAGANIVWNVRIETTTIQGKQANQSGGIEVLAYGTAMNVTG